jgi:tetratricopeptide (TPR) repeat protein
MAFDFYLLGELQIVRHGAQVPPPPYRCHSLLAALLLRPRPQRRDLLSGLIFPDLPERTGRQRLSHLLWLLRRSLPELPLEASAQAVCLPPETRWLDVEAFWQTAVRPALRDWLKAPALSPDNPAAYDTAGLALFLLGDPAGAEAAFRNGLALAPDDGRLQDNLGLALRQKHPFANFRQKRKM